MTSPLTITSLSFLACSPRLRQTSELESSSAITAFVNPLQSLACAPGEPILVVRAELSISTPCSLQRDRSPEFGSPGKSVASSFMRFFKLWGFLTPSDTANAKPQATPLVGYGSWPISKTFTDSKGLSKALITKPNGGVMSGSFFNWLSISSSRPEVAKSLDCHEGCMELKNMYKGYGLSGGTMNS